MRQEIVICKACGKHTANPRPWRKRAFCGQKCRLNYNSLHGWGTPFKAGQIAWNKELTKETSSIVRKYAQSVSKARKGKFTGKDNSFYGKHHSEETKKLIGSYHYVGHRNVSKGYYGRGFNEKLKMAIKMRDEFTCQECGNGVNDTKLAIHHINYDTTDHRPENLITLCIACNSKANFNREDWIKHFQARLKRKQIVLKKKGGV